MNTRINHLKERISDIKKRLPAHSAKPGMLNELEELEEELDRLTEDKNENPGPGLSREAPAPNPGE